MQSSLNFFWRWDDRRKLKKVLIELIKIEWTNQKRPNYSLVGNITEITIILIYSILDFLRKNFPIPLEKDSLL